MKLTLNNRFLRACESLSLEELGKLMWALVQLRAAISDVHRHSGLGLRKLSPRLWELRLGISVRAVFALEQDEALFCFLARTTKCGGFFVILDNLDADMR